MKNVAIIGAVVIVILGVGYLATSTDTPSAPVAGTAPAADEAAAEFMNDAVAAMGTDESTLRGEAEGATEDDTVDTSTRAEAPGSYQDYSAATLASSEAETNVLFFAASWCPSCRALDNNIVANQSDIPDGVAIFKADYDAETALKQQYGVVRQHSIVVLDAAGAQQGSVTHPATLEQLLAGL
jgi:thiol:disulfide interchange protein